MKVVMLSKALVSGAYQKKLEELARLPDMDLVAVVPPFWREPMVGPVALERRFTAGYRLEVLPIGANGQHHGYFFRGLPSLLWRERPDVVHIDEESFNLATFLAMRAAVRVGARCCFFNWANIDRRYPIPFCWFEQYSFRHAAYGIAGNQEAAAILRRHGYGGPLEVLPQFGVDPDLFAPSPSRHRPPSAPFVVGYVGRLIAWKGVLDLVEVLAELPAQTHLWLVGDGNLRPTIEQRVRERSLEERVVLRSAVPSSAVPDILNQLDVLVLPSQTQPTWKEQFGRILIEAMSCGVPVIGSSSGEIPNVVGEAGLVVPEGNRAALRNALEHLIKDPSLRHTLSQRGRERVLQHYTQAALAQSYYDLYCAMMKDKGLLP